MLLKSSLVFFGVCVVVAVIFQSEVETCRPMTETEMRLAVGGHGGASCDSCQNSTERMDECAHFTDTDSCRTDQCIENWLIENSCQAAAQSNCWATLNPYLDYLIQYLRNDSDCATDNPSNWDLWRIHYYGSACKTRIYEKRCQKATNNCNGTLLETSKRTIAIDCI